MMKLMHHGGKCCGIKTLFNMGYIPEGLHYAIPAVTTLGATDGSLSSIGTPWYREARPEETGLERIKAYIKFYEKNRKTGILECVLQTPKKPNDYGNGQAAWIPVLLKLGFKEVNTWPNSNSTNILHVFNLNIGEKVKKIKKVKESEAQDEEV